MIELNRISKRYASKRGSPIVVLEQMDLKVDAGEFVAVSGPSGCGKSTLLLIAGSLLNPDSGTVVVDGKTFTAMSSDQKARERAQSIGFVFQRFHLLPYLTVRENILAGGVALKSDPGDRVTELMDRLGITKRAEHLPGELSVGEMQRTALARAFLNEPSVILADEPTGNLDPENAAVVLRAFADFAKEGGAVLMVTHNPADAEHATRTLQMTSS